MARRDFRRKVAAWLELPADVLLDEARLTLLGAREMVVENHRGLRNYRQDQVVLGLPSGSVAIEGEGLVIGLISAEQVSIQGRITAIRYED